MDVLSLLTFGLLSCGFVLCGHCPCHEKGACWGHAKDEGPLNMTAERNTFDQVRAGDRAYIWHCVDHATSFHWFKLGHSGRLVPFPSEDVAQRVQCCDNNQTLSIDSVSKNDEGVYTYVASNGTAEITGNFTLAVSCKNADPQLSFQGEKVQHVRLGSQKTLRCAGQFGHCPHHKNIGRMQWIWQDSDGTQEWIFENTSRIILICDRLEHDCNLTIIEVTEMDFRGKYICKLMSTRIFFHENFTISLRPAVVVPDFLPAQIAGIAVGAACAVGVTVATLLLIWYCHGEHIKFLCCPQPNREQYTHDAVLVHGDDHKQLVREVLTPQLKERGYDIMEETARPERPETLEHSEAILNSYSVILSYSAAELGCDSQGIFLTELSKKTHCHKSVVVIRTHEDKDIVSDGMISQNRAEDRDRSGEDCLQTLNSLQATSIWKHKVFKSVKILTLPKNMEKLRHSSNNSSDVSLAASWKQNKFWYSLFNHLPKPEHISQEAKNLKKKKRNSSASSQQKLLANQERSNYKTGDVSHSGQYGFSAEIAPVEVMSHVDRTDLPSEDIPLRISDLSSDCFSRDEVFTNPMKAEIQVHVPSDGDRFSHPDSRERGSWQDVAPAVQDYRQSAPATQPVAILNPVRAPYYGVSSPVQTPLTRIQDASQNGDAFLSDEVMAEMEKTIAAQMGHHPQQSPTSLEAGGGIEGQDYISRPSIMTQESGYHSMSPSKGTGSPPSFQTPRPVEDNVAVKDVVQLQE